MLLSPSNPTQPCERLDFDTLIVDRFRRTTTTTATTTITTTSVSSAIMANDQPASLLSVSWATRRSVIEHVNDGNNSSNSISTRSVAPLQVPALGQTSRQLREEHFQYYCYERDIVVDLALELARSRTGQWLSQYGDVVISNARQIAIKMFEDVLRGHSIGMTVVIALGRHAAPTAHMPGPMLATSGNVRVGEVNVVFGYRDDIQHNTVVARQLATAANEILASHRRDSLARISPRELQQIVGVLNDIVGVRLGGLRDEWETDHVDQGAAADFWSMID
jgi:hypothetical protein